MKIKILKDIPGYKAGEEIYVSDIPDATPEKVFNSTKNDGFSYDYHFLIKEGYAEEIKDDIDIEAIRNMYGIKYRTLLFKSKDGCCTGSDDEETIWFSVYRIVKAVIDQLNETEKYNGKFVIAKVNHSNGVQFAARDVTHKMFHYSILENCHTHKIAHRVIELCEPELKLLFGVK